MSEPTKPIQTGIRHSIQLCADARRVRCLDVAGLIGEGFHERTIVDEAKFIKRMAAKAGKRHV